MEQSTEINGYGNFAIGRYFQIMTKMIGEPGQFFSDISNAMSFTQALGCLVISCLFFTGASLTQLHETNILIAGILFLNAVAMPMIAACVTFVVINISFFKSVTFVRLLSVYSYAASVTLLLSWIPLFIWLTEPWKWVLVYKGLTRGCGLKRVKTILVIVITVSALALLFRSLEILTFYMKGLI